MRHSWKVVALGLLAGVVGMLIVLGGMHIWQDHWRIHQTEQKVDAVIHYLNQAQAQQKPQK